MLRNSSSSEKLSGSMRKEAMTALFRFATRAARSFVFSFCTRIRTWGKPSTAYKSDSIQVWSKSVSGNAKQIMTHGIHDELEGYSESANLHRGGSPRWTFTNRLFYCNHFICLDTFSKLLGIMCLHAFPRPLLVLMNVDCDMGNSM